MKTLSRSARAARAVCLCAASPGMVWGAADAAADALQPFREIAETRRDLSPDQLADAIRRLEAVGSDDVEKPYLLGTLHLRRGLAILSDKRRSTTNPPADEAVRDPAVREAFALARARYDALERTRPAYKLVYCRYAELYRHSFDRKAMSDLVVRLADAPAGEATAQCRKLVTDIADEYATRGLLPHAENIYRAVVATWKPYPEYMLEAIGDAEDGQRNSKQARLWWKRCAAESTNPDRRDRCQRKLTTK